MSSNTSGLEAHVGFFRLLMKGIFGPYVLLPFDKKLIFQLLTRIRAIYALYAKSKVEFSCISTNKVIKLYVYKSYKFRIFFEQIWWYGSIVLPSAREVDIHNGLYSICCEHNNRAENSTTFWLDTISDDIFSMTHCILCLVWSKMRSEFVYCWNSRSN